MKTNSIRSAVGFGVAVLCAGMAFSAQAAGWTIGQVAPLSGTGAAQGRAYSHGMRLYFDQVNKAGGVQGRPVELLVIDDAGQPNETIEKTRKLLSDTKPLALAGYFGNKNLSALLDSKLLDISSTSLVGYQSTDTRVLNAPQLFSSRAGLSEQMSKIASHLAVLGITKLALVHDERSDAKELSALVNKSVSSSGAQLVNGITLGNGKKGLDAAIDKLKTKPAQAVLVVASSPNTAAFVEAYRLDGGLAQIYAMAEADVEQLAMRLPLEYLSGLSIAQVVPSPYKVSMRLNKEFQDSVAAAGKKLEVPVSFTMMEGYVNAKLLVEAMRRSQPLTPEKLTQTLRVLDGYDMGGYWISYKPGSQIGSSYVDLSIVNASWRVTQ